MTIGEAIYLLCAATSVAAAVLLMRQYAARRTPMLLWSCIGFLGLAVNNVLVYLDFSVVRGTDLSLPRSLAGATAMVALVYGLIRDAGE
jgi:hypothetical protein